MHPSHCADAVISLSKQTNIVGEVSAKLVDLAAYWVQTLSGYETIMAKVLSTSWAADHMPVISRRGHDPSRFTNFVAKNHQSPAPLASTPGQEDHILVTAFSLGQPGGKTVSCPGNCDWTLKVKPTASGVHFTCERCKFKCTTPKFKTDRSKTLEQKALVAVKFPPDSYLAEWKKYEDVEESESDKSQPTSPFSRSITPPPVSTAPSNPPVQSRPIRPIPTIRLPPPEAIARSHSLPSSTTITPMSSSSSLRIRLPRMPSTPHLSLAGPSSTDGTSSGDVTPPPESPLESPQERPPVRKRTAQEITRGIWEKRPRQDKQ